MDTDVLKSALIGSGISISDAGPATYSGALALSKSLLEQGRRVILDSPCRYLELLDGGRGIATRAGVPYKFIEVWAADTVVLLPRLDTRQPLVSQVASSAEPVPGTSWEFGTAAATLAAWREQLVRPGEDWLRLDAENASESNLALALEYLS